MKHASLLNQDWRQVVDRLGGAPAIEASARATKAFQRARGVPGAVVLLRLVLAYCLRQGGLRSTAAWARRYGDWLIFPMSPCSIGCAGAAIGWPYWSAACLPPRRRRPAAAAWFA